LVDQIFDKREVVIPGPAGDVTPEAIACRQAAESARDAAQAHQTAAEQAQHAAELARDDGRALSTELLPSDGSPFGGIPGLRAGTPDPLVEVAADKTAVVVHAHAGWIRTGGRLVGYTLTADARMPIPRPANWYDIEVLIDDAGTTACRMSETSHGTPIKDPDDGMHLARYMGGPIQQDAITINQDAMLVSPSLTALKRLKAVEGQRGQVSNDPTSSNNGQYVYRAGVWGSVARAPVILGKQRENGMTSAAGAFGVNYTSPDGTAPDVLVVSNGPYVNGYEDYGRDYQLMRWGDATPDGFQVRVARGGQWVSSVPVFFSWLAVWLHPGVKS
jgi:hypothetical protein